MYYLEGRVKKYVYEINKNEKQNKYNYKFFCGCKGNGWWWFRIKGYGFSWKRIDNIDNELFSVRNKIKGFKIGKWYFRFLKRFF